MRLAIVLSHPTQYYSPWFRWLRRETALEFRVFYLWDFGVAARRDPEFGVDIAWDTDLRSGYDHEFVPNRASRPGTDHFYGLRNPSLPARLAAWRPDAVLLFGYRYATHLRTVFWCRRRRLPLIFRGDSHLLGRPGPSASKRLVLRALFRRFAAVTYTGLANRSYFEVFGVPAARLHFAPHAVDHELFDPRRPDHQEAAGRLRDQLGLPTGTTVILFAGKLVPRKQPRELLEAYLGAPRPGVALVFVGDGGEKAALQQRAAAVPAAAVRFLPFANQRAMPGLYLLADLFALPSRGHSETWGLAVNEAMHMGVPCLVSDVVGCQPDLVTHGETGWVFRANEPADLAAHLDQALAALASDAVGYKARIAARIAGYTYVQTTAGLMQAISQLTPPA